MLGIVNESRVALGIGVMKKSHRFYLYRQDAVTKGLQLTNQTN